MPIQSVGDPSHLSRFHNGNCEGLQLNAAPLTTPNMVYYKPINTCDLPLEIHL